MPRTFWSTTQSNNAQSTKGTQKEGENRAQMQSWKQIQEQEIKDWKDSCSYHKK